MDFIEIIGELLIEFVGDAFASLDKKKRRRILRVPLIIALVCLDVWLPCAGLNKIKQSPALSVFLFLLAAALIPLIVKLIRQASAAFQSENEEPDQNGDSSTSPGSFDNI